LKSRICESACGERIKALQDKLDAPNKRHQAYQEALKGWEQQKKLIEGDIEKPDTLKHIEGQLKYIKELRSMSIEKNVRIVKNFLAALGRRDKQGLLALSASPNSRRNKTGDQVDAD
jgi:hypothetical protein